MEQIPNMKQNNISLIDDSQGAQQFLSSSIEKDAIQKNDFLISKYPSSSLLLTVFVQSTRTTKMMAKKRRWVKTQTPVKLAV